MVEGLVPPRKQHCTTIRFDTNSAVAIELNFFCGAHCYVALGMRAGYRCTRAVAQRHIIPIKGFAGTASVQRHASSVLGELPRGSRRLRALWPSSLDRPRRKRL